MRFGGPRENPFVRTDLVITTAPNKRTRQYTNGCSCKGSLGLRTVAVRRGLRSPAPSPAQINSVRDAGSGVS